MKPQIIYDMPFDEYKAVKAVSGSSLKEMLKSPMAYWHRYVNPEYQESDPSPQMLLGKAYHTRFCEGAEAFTSQYAVKPEKPESGMLDGKPVLVTVSDIKDFLDYTATPYKKSGKKDDLATLVKPETAILWDRFITDWETKNASKEIISQQWADEIKRAEKVLCNLQSFNRLWEEGRAEVSIFWQDEATALPCKARIDFLTPYSIIELKTLSNSVGKDIATACIHEIGYQRYGISAVHYMYGLNYLISQGVTEFASDHRPGFQFAFIQTGDYPVFYSREYAMRFNGKVNEYWRTAMLAREHALSEIKRYTESFGDKPWHDEQTGHAFDDVEFPMWMLEGAA